MNEILKIQSSLKKRAKLLNQAELLENRARDLKENASKNDLYEDIRVLHIKIFKLVDRIDLLNNLISLVYTFENGPISITLEEYQSNTIQGKSLEMIENELKDLSNEVIFLVSLLNQLCSYIGHDYRFIGIDNVFDFESLEITFEEKEIHYCAICGKATYFDLNGKKECDNNLLVYLKKLRKAQKMQVYVSKFIIQENLSR